MSKSLRNAVIVVVLIILSGVVAVTRPWQYIDFLPFLGNGAALTVNVPQGKAEVYIDDKKVGETPYESDDLAPGDSRIKLVRISDEEEFYTEISKQIHLESNTRTFFEAEIGPSTQFSSIKILYYKKDTAGNSSLYINSSPKGATAWIDDVKHGETPATSQNLKPGTYSLKLTNSGYEDLETDIIMREGYTLIAEIQLMAKPVELE